MIERYETLGSVTCRIRSRGDSGSPVVLVHGLGGNADNWNPLLERLGERAVFALDLPGFGYSSPVDRHTIPTHVETVAALINQIGQGPVTLVGNSMGGMIAEITAVEHPDLVDRLVLIAPATPLPSLDSVADLSVTMRIGSQALPGIGPALIQAWQRRLTPQQQVEETFRIVAHRPELIPLPVRARAVEIAEARRKMPWAARAFSESALSVGVRLANRSAFRELVGRIRQPTLLVWGAEDRVVSPRALEWLAALRPDWDHARLEDVGHVPMVEAADTVADLIARVPETT